MKKNLFIILFVFLGYAKNHAQKHELGNVTLEELKEKVCPKDSSAVAAILFEKGRTFFDYKQNYGFSIVTEVEVKIKVYKKEGYNWANKSVNFYIGGDDDENVSFSKAITYNLVDGKIEKTKLKSEGEFTENTNKFWSRKKITMPNIKEGSIVEYKYTITSPYISTFPEWSFQGEIPVVYSEYVTEVPEYFIYTTYRKGSFKLNESKTFKSKTITLTSKQRILASMSNGGHSGTNVTNNEIVYIENINSFIAENVPSLKEEAFVNNIDNYKASVQHELSGKQLPQTVFESFSTTWEDVAKKIYENESFGNQLNKSNYYEADLKNVLQSLTSEEEKVSAIFKFVQSRMTWNKYNSLFCDDGVKVAYDSKTGNTAEINLILVSMLRNANLNANPVLVSTRANGISLYPSRTAFNIVIASVLINGNLVLMDATSKSTLPGILPTRDLNWFGRIIKKDGFSEMVDLMPTNSSMEVVNALVKIDENGGFTGQVKQQYFDYNALNFRENSAILTNNAIIEKKEKEYQGLEVENYELNSNSNDLTQPVIEKYTIKDNNLTEVIADKLYFSPLLFFTMSENPFKQDSREYPIDFSFPFKDKYMINISLPEGYQVETLPKSIAIAMPNKYGSFNYTISNENSQIQLVVALDIATSIISAEDYDTLKEFFKVAIDKEKEKIVLKKI